jgi:hypothetical protein
LPAISPRIRTGLAFADALEMKPGKPAALSLAREYPNWIDARDLLRRRHNLASRGLDEFVGLSFQYADSSVRYGQSECRAMPI